MTALTVPARPEEDTSLRPVPWRRMAWVTWRQHRTALVGVAVFLGALAVCLWRVGLGLHHAYAAAAACRPATGPIAVYGQTRTYDEQHQGGSFVARDDLKCKAEPASSALFASRGTPWYATG